MGGSPVMYNLSSLAKTKQETDDGHVSVVQVSGGWSEQRVAESVGSQGERAEAILWAALPRRGSSYLQRVQV